MNEDSRCQGREKMMGRGAEGGCGTEEKTCPVVRLSPPATVPANFPATFPATIPEKSRTIGLAVDYYSQAVKALSERSPFDSNEVLSNTVATLPSGLASLLSKQSDSKKKHKRPHSETKSSRKGSSEKSKGTNSIWTKLEDYFRELTLQDIERLHQFYSSLGALLNSSDSCLKIPKLGNASDVPAAVLKEEEVVLDADCGMLDAGAVEDKEEVDREMDKLQNVKLENGSRDSLGAVEEGPSPEYSSYSCSSIEWVLGSRSRVLMTTTMTTRPAKKRKLFGVNSELERLIVAQPCEGSSSLCHVCSMGDTRDQLNQLVACKSCNVVVHQKCYGVQGEIDGYWLCSWCKHKIDAQARPASAPVSDRPCVFCPKKGGALKPFQNTGSGNDGSVEFAHLFCSMWMPEVYIGDTRLMEPVLSHGTKDVRGKLACNLCKVKLGSCVRCSDGPCRTSFHPICAREARNKLEIWGRFGCDDIEMRVFCAKHSEDVSLAGSIAIEHNELNHTSGSDSVRTLKEATVMSGSKIKKLKIGCKNGDKVSFNMGASDTKSHNSGEREGQNAGLKDASSNIKPNSVSDDGQKSSDMGLGGAGEDVKTSCVLDLGLVLKKLMDQGKISLEQIAAEIGIAEASLASRVNDNDFSHELHCKILSWLKNCSYVDTTEKDWKARLSCLMPSKPELRTDDKSDADAARHLGITDVPVKSVPPRRRTVGNKEEKVIFVWKDKMHNNVVSSIEGTEQEEMKVDHDNSSKDSILVGMEEIVVETNGFEPPSAKPSPTSENVVLKRDNVSDVEHNGAEDGTSSAKSSLLDLDQETPSCSSADMAGCCDGNIEPGIESYVHPYILKILEQVQSRLIRKAPDCNGCMVRESLAAVQTLSAVSGEELSVCIGEDGGCGRVKLEDLRMADEMDIFDMSPEDEVEGEIIYYQQKLLCNSVALKHCGDQLVCKIVKDLPTEIDLVRKRRWDSVLVNQYMYELKEARKQGRKERRHKEAQAVLAAATAAAAASSRVSSLRKDAVDESPQQENQLKVEGTRLRGSLSSLSIPHVKVSSPSFDVPKAKSDVNSRTAKEHPKSCDICRRSESLLNPILVCSSCKVAVHPSCYRSVKESTGPWYCELCEESFLSKGRATFASELLKPNSSEECVLCGISSGAFRKSSNGQWVHAFCAEWVFDSSFRRGQVYPVAGMETVVKGNDICSVCHKRYGVCIKCNYGNCQSTFHPSCARDAGYYLYSKYMGGGKIQHKSYCSKHSLEQKAKAETQKHGAEDLKVVKQHRVELEKLRLLCERIVKREKLKRELVVCNQDIVASRRDSLVVSVLDHRALLSSLESSDSATTSHKEHVDCSRSCSDAMQRSDDITVDSALSTKRCIRLPQSIIENDRKTEDSSTSNHHPTPKPTDRVSFAGKQIPIRAALASRNFSHSAEDMLQPKKNLETFEKELVMTSDQASMKNRRLPKGYIYVPIDYLSNGKPVSRSSDEGDEVDE